MNPAIDTMSQADLLARRAALVSKGKAIELPTEELEELCAIFNRLRQHSSGPPSSAKKKKEKVILSPDEIPG
jgi:hypothetical protein